MAESERGDSKRNFDFANTIIIACKIIQTKKLFYNECNYNEGKGYIGLISSHVRLFT